MLNWVKTNKSLSVLVKNRINGIRSEPNIVFKYTPTNDNLADKPTRGEPATDLKPRILQWNSPERVSSDADNWNIPEVTKETLEKIQSEQTGLDYFRPLYVKNGTVQSKAWACIFTCITVRAIHLELVEDMAAAQFLACLKRFVARTGKPDGIISDNAPQFKVAKNAIQLAWENVVKDPDVIGYVNERPIKWSFTVELSPGMGGFYERFISITKMALKKASESCLTSIQLQTILTEIEAIVNSRPLVYIINEVEHRTIITPTHFLSINARTLTSDIDDP